MGVYFVEGRVARQNGLSITDNPYIDNTPESAEWDKGFKSASSSKFFY